MSDIAGIVRVLAGPLQAELRKGCRDATIIGSSLASYATSWVERAATILPEDQRAACRQVARLLEGYAGLAPAARRTKVKAALDLLGRLAGRPGAGNADGDATAGPRRPRRPARPVRPTARPEPTVLDQPIGARSGATPAWAKRLAKLGIATNRDLLFHFPRDYLTLRKIAELEDGERAAVLVTAGARGEAIQREGRGFRLMRYTLQVSDDSGQAWVTSFARLPRHGGPRTQAILGSPLALNYQPGAVLLIEGSVRRAGPFIGIQQSGCERLTEEPRGAGLPHGALVPVYPLTDGVYQGQVRGGVRAILSHLPDELADPLPPAMLREHALPALRTALHDIHWPATVAARDAARKRLAFEELLFLQLALAQRKRELQRPAAGISMPPRGDVVAALEGVLPFSLTRAQQRAIAELTADMAADTPMCRLLQGDVGSGKTVVAAAALLIAAQNGYQGALMAPTEILAEQHFLVMSRLLRSLGVTVELLTGSLRGQDRERAQQRIRTGKPAVVVGTHALIQEHVSFRRLGVVIVDEQHRFGVRERSDLRTKGRPLGGPPGKPSGPGAPPPDMLVMTATPIPRTLALTLYGDLDLSVLDEMPPGRRAIKTLWLPLTRQEEAFALARRQVAEGRQACVVCPLIEESETLQAEAATKLAKKLQKEDFSDLRVALLHGGMPVAEREQVMEAFRAGEIDVITATTVIEVGVDVPNATIMLILNAERFGLSQLHQLRGRVGRAGHESYCVLLTAQRYDPTGRLVPGGRAQSQDDTPTDSLELARRRLRVMLDTTDGFAIAEHDLLLRGPGEFYGTRQHGLPDFRLARLAADLGVLEEARQAGFDLIARDPHLAAPEHAGLRQHVQSLRLRMERSAG
jgi:ATP-dependent DNA helicase RecG